MSESHHRCQLGVVVTQRAEHKHIRALTYLTARETSNPPIIASESTMTTVISAGERVAWSSDSLV